MVALITDPQLQADLIAQRRASGADRYDEVWEGVYVMSPLADLEHQELATRLTKILLSVTDEQRDKVFAGCNVSDRRKNWTKNFRCPDAAVFLQGTTAVHCKTHWCGGPDFAVEIISPDDQTLDKLPFYAKVGTRELLVIDRDPWELTLYHLTEGCLIEAGRSTVANTQPLSSKVLPLTWRLVNDEGRPAIEIVHADGVQRWLVPSGG